MSTLRKLGPLASVSIMPVVFVLAFLAAFVVMGVGDALAQPAGEPERPPHGFAPPHDDAPDPDADAAHVGDTVGGTDVHGTAQGPAGVADAHGGHGGGHGDPTKHFNFFSLDYRGKDVMGGKYGDGVMVDPHTGEVHATEEPMSAPFFLMVLNFLLLVGLLGKWRPDREQARRRAPRSDQDRARRGRQAAHSRRRTSSPSTRPSSRTADAEIKKIVEGIRAGRRGGQGAHPRERREAVGRR